MGLGTWTTPRTWKPPEAVTETILDTHIKGNLAHIGPHTWQNVAWDASDFTGSGSMDWTTASTDIELVAYVLTGNTMVVTVRIVDTTVAGTPDVSLQMAVPGGQTVDGTHWGVCKYSDNGTDGVGAIRANGTTLQFRKLDESNWAAEVNNTDVSGSITFEVT